MTVTAHPLHQRSLDVAAAAMERGFEGYVVPLRCTADSLARRIRSEHIDPMVSLVYELDGVPAGILLVARRGRTTRIAAFGLAPALRRQGLGRSAMATAIEAARARGDDRLLLEVIATNHPAIALYEALGFVRTRRLVGYRKAGDVPAEAETGITECDPADAARLIGAWSSDDLSWQLRPESFAGAAAPLRGFVLGELAAALIDDSGPDVRLVSLAVRPARRWQGVGSRLLGGLCHRFAGRAWSISAILPEGLAFEFLVRTGWELVPLSQFEMSLTLQPAVHPMSEVAPCHA